MMLAWAPSAWEDYLSWQQADKRMVKHIHELVRSAMRTPFESLGKPESLRFDLAGCWSRRIDREHRFVYQLNEATDSLSVLQCRYHY